MREVGRHILDRTRSGDLEALRILLESLQCPIYQTVHRMVGRRFAADVEDITQEILIKILHSLGRFDPDRGVKFSTWIFTFVKNHCFDVLKKRRLETIPLESHDPHQAVLSLPEVENPAATVENEELVRHIEAAVASLPPEQRLAFVLRQYEGLAYDQIAAVLGCSQGTVKSRIHRAKDALRHRLTRYVG
ncbi:MAG: RNA polymerase sigma factor [Planctomycetota bacterium]